MRTLISLHPETHFLITSFSSQRRNPTFFLPKRFFPNFPKSIFSSVIIPSCSVNPAPLFNGWDDLRVRDDSDELDESNLIKFFLSSLGIDDKKYVFASILGFFCALAISRVRVSSLVIFPAAAVVFAIGFSFGFVNGKPQKGFSLNGSKKRANDEYLRDYVEKLKDLENLFDGFGVKINELRDDIKKAIDHERIEVGDLEGYVSAVDTIGGLVLNARNVVENCMDSVLGEGEELGKNLIQKNKKKKEIGESGFNLFEYMGVFLGDFATGPKSSRTNVVKRASVAKGVDNRVQERNLRGLDAERGLNSVAPPHDREVERVLQRAKVNTLKEGINTKKYVDASLYDYEDLRFEQNRQVNSNMSAYRDSRKWTSEESIINDLDFDISSRMMESDASMNDERILQKPNWARESSRCEESVDYGNYTAGFREERINVEDNLGSFSSPTISDDILFDKYLLKANDLLSQAKEFIKVRNDETLAEETLHESAKLLSQAISMKPMSLLAIGQLGNTYLLHGELKLRISRKLRRLLHRKYDYGSERQSSLFDEAMPSRDRTSTLLVNVCEECEALLVEAGRKYKTAIAIDGNDLRALYNWGLALSFRAQLIADIGPETAVDADRLFLAAIDKFDAMMSRSNVFATEALFRWGVALQQRSRLRPSNSRDKVKLLQQAKRLYEDALDMGSENLQLRQALSSCVSELDFTDLQ